MFVCTLRKGGLKKVAAVAVCGVALAAVAIGVGKIWQNEDTVDVAAGQPTMAPVSYTHLDVYKRQVWALPIPSRPSRLSARSRT